MHHVVLEPFQTTDAKDRCVGPARCKVLLPRGYCAPLCTAKISARYKGLVRRDEVECFRVVHVIARHIPSDVEATLHQC